MNRLRRLEAALKSRTAEDSKSRLEAPREPKANGQPQASPSQPPKGSAENPKLPRPASDKELADFDRWNPMMEDFVSASNSLTLGPLSDPLTSITGKIQPIRSKIGNVSICERFARYGECADGRFCQFVHVEPASREKIWALQNTYESNKGRTCMNFTFLSALDLKADPSALLLVSMATISSPSNFYVMAPFENLNFANLGQSDIKFYVDRIQEQSSAKKKLEQFHQQMADIFGHSYRVDNLNDDIYLSQIVACKLGDGHFRRAMVVGLPDAADCADVYYKLFLIDVGVEKLVPRDFIYDIKANILSEPPLALNCRLDIKPAGGALEWSAGAGAQFRALVGQNCFSFCRVLEHIKADRILTVDLLDLNTKASYTDKMLSSGLAAKCGP